MKKQNGWLPPQDSPDRLRVATVTHRACASLSLLPVILKPASPGLHPCPPYLAVPSRYLLNT